MKEIFQIGDFRFRLQYPEEVILPDHFQNFRIDKEEAESENARDCQYEYELLLAERLPEPAGDIAAKRADLVVFREGTRESRLIGVKGRSTFYAYYQEVSSGRARITLDKEQISDLNIDPVFTSLFALERHLIQKDQMILHCAYVEYRGEAILFSAPSETGKTTQANLWEKYRGSRTVNGDRALLGRRDDRWMAMGWPVCGTSQICQNDSFPVKAIVMLSQAGENRVRRLTPGAAFPLLYSQITVNKWNPADHVHAPDLMERLLDAIPVLHLECTISEEAVIHLEEMLSHVTLEGWRNLDA